LNMAGMIRDGGFQLVAVHLRLRRRGAHLHMRFFFDGDTLNGG
jgi:hypothetical protein